MSVKEALDRYYEKDAQKLRRKSKRGARKNAKPEKALEAQVLKWAQSRGLDLCVIEAKAVYSKGAGRYLRGQAEAGLPDLIGNFQGLSVWIELKAPGRLSTLKAHQRAFLVRKVKQGCFAVCVDSVELLRDLFQSYLDAPIKDRESILMDNLPKPRNQKDSDSLFED